MRKREIPFAYQAASGFVCFFLLLSATFARAAEPPAHRVNGDLAVQARDIFVRYCAECHTGSLEVGQSKLKLLDHKQLTAKGRPVPLVAPNGRSQILELIKDGSMPPANRAGPTPAEVVVLEKWVKANTPAYPESFDERFTLQAIADNLDTANASKHYRYVSFANLIRDGQPLPNLAESEQRLNAALSLAAGKPVAVEPVDATATLFRIDLGELGWTTRELFNKFEDRKFARLVGLQPFDLLLLEYPHAATLPNDSLAKRLEKFLASQNQIRPVAFVRGDWLTSALATDGKLTSLAQDIKSLAVLEKAIAGGMPEPDGPAVPRTLGTAPPFVAPRFTDGRAPIPPLSGWYASDTTPSLPPFTLSAELVAGTQPVKSVKVDQRFKLRVQSDRRVYLTLLMIQADGEVRVQQIDGGSVLQANTPRELAPGADGFIISGIITGGNSATEYFVLFASETELPLPVVVRSKHNDRSVWRFLLEPTEKEPFDVNKVVRRVVAIPVMAQKAK